jgi:hypothetical protein
MVVSKRMRWHVHGCVVCVCITGCYSSREKVSSVLGFSTLGLFSLGRTQALAERLDFFLFLYLGFLNFIVGLTRLRKVGVCGRVGL